MFEDYTDRLVAEEAFAEWYNEMSPDEQRDYWARLEKAQKEAIEGDYFERAFADMRGEDEERER